MDIIGRRLIGPKIAAIALCVYAGVYGLLLLLMLAIVSSGFDNFVPFWMIGLLAMAVTPFVAVAHLYRAAMPDVDPPARPITMAVVMAVPTIFWLYMFLDNVDLDSITELTNQHFALVYILIPGLLSLWLVVAFALLARRDRRIP